MKEKLQNIFTLERILITLLLILAGAMITFAAHWIEASNTIKVHEAKIHILQASIESSEKEISELVKENTDYEEDIELLTLQVNTAAEATAGLVSEKEQLEVQKAELERSNGELLAQNGDLSKKFTILSKPS
jgi:chromosome segregation ATPase